MAIQILQSEAVGIGLTMPTAYGHYFGAVTTGQSR